MPLTSVTRDRLSAPGSTSSQHVGHDPDLLLVQRVVQWHDEAAFLRLYRRHTPAMERVLRGSGVRDEDQLDDLIQETWLRATRRLSNFAGRSSLRTWLVGVAINVRREAWRRRTPRLLPLSLASEIPTASAALDDDWFLQDLLATLPQPLRQVFELRAIDGMSHQEIGARLQLSPGNVRIRYHRARRMLRERFASDNNAGDDHE